MEIMTVCAYPGCKNEAVVFQPAPPRSWLERVADLPCEKQVGLCEQHQIYVGTDMERYRRAGLGRAVLDIYAQEDARILAELAEAEKRLQQDAGQG
jgi:hypothetical protein